MEKAQLMVCQALASKMCSGKLLLLTFFFNKSEEVVNYLEIKCPHFSYTHLPSDDVVKSKIENIESRIIKDCMKQYLMVFTKSEPVLCKEYLCSCSSCLGFNFKKCSGDEAPRYSKLSMTPKADQ